jgi:hypothetical protein
MTGAAARAEPRIVVRECHAKRNGDAAGEWKRCHIIKPIERLSIVENDPQTRRMDARLPRVTTPGALYWAENSTIKGISPGCFCAPSRDQSSPPCPSSSDEFTSSAEQERPREMLLLAWPRVLLHARYVDRLDVRRYVHNALLMCTIREKSVSSPQISR